MNFILPKSRKKSFLLMLLTCVSFSFYAQTENTIKGKVVAEASAETQVGVIIRIKGTSVATTTDVNGNFELKTTEPFPFTLLISYIGFQTKEVEIYEAEDPLEIKLQASNVLKEVVVVGYGEQNRKDVTGSISSVPTELKSQPVVSIERLLQGSVAGAQVTQVSGQPGAGVSVSIRGYNSINAGNDPLYVIDGYPIYNDYTVGNAGVTGGPQINPLSSIPTSDIESIEVLKDASATAIYGSRGANGVVIVTTKKGKDSTFSVTYDEYTGVSSVIREIPLLNAGQFWKLREQAAINTGTYGALLGANASIIASAKNQGYNLDTSGQGTNWQKAAFRNAITQSHNLSIMSGTDKTKLGVSFNYFNQDGVLINTNFIRYAGRINVEHNYSKKFKLTASINASNISANVAPANVVPDLLFTPPSVPIYNSSGSYVIQSPFEAANPTIANPINTLVNEINQTKTNRFLGNVSAQYKILPNLTAKILVGADVTDNVQNQYLPTTISEGAALGGYAAIGSQFTTNWLNENTLTYSKVIKKIHKLNVLGGFTAQQSITEGSITAAAGFPNNLSTFNNIGSGVSAQPVSSSASEWALASFLGRVNYGLKDKYLVTVTLRADGSSRFGPNNKWGYFPSIAVAWNAHQEDFLKDIKWLSNLKLRGSVGNTGNQSIPPYSSLSQLGYYRYNFSNTTVAGYAPQTAYNPNLGWEQTTQTDFGTDLGFLKNRIAVTADVYYKLTTNLLLSEPVSGTSGLSYYNATNNAGQTSTIFQNTGAMENKGYEVAVLTQNLINKFKWNTTFLISENFNKILSLGDGISQEIPNTSQPSVLQVGAPIGSFLVYKTNGVIQPGETPLTPTKDTKPGGQQYVDVNGDGKITTADQVVLKNNPPVILGLTNTFKYGGFDLTVFLQASIGGLIYNANEATLEEGTGYLNSSTVMLNGYSATNTNTSVKSPYQDPTVTISNRFIESASYGRLKNITLGYTVPLKITEKAKIKSLRFYVSAQNLLTWTKYTGFDPEASSNGQSLINKGYDSGTYPNSKMFLGGVTVTF